MKDWFKEYCQEKERADKLQVQNSILEKFMGTLISQNDLRLGEHLHYVERKNLLLKREVRSMQEKAEEFNKLLYATGLIVNCTGCEAGGPANPENLTEEKVKKVEMIAQRLRSWWNSHCCRMQKIEK